MTEDITESIAPFIYGFIEAMRAYDNAYNKASRIYSSLTGKEAQPAEDSLAKAISLLFSEVRKMDFDAEAFIKKYKEFESLFAIAKKFAGG
jgi:hypothetical protein